MTDKFNNILDSYARSAPSPQNALNIFKSEWASRLPEALAGCEAGGIELFDDDRINWFLEEIGAIKGKTVLELGPLEGGHSYMLEKAGASQVIAVESNTRAYLKCLIVKELLGLEKTRFLCGDFVDYLREDGPAFEVCLASGVLYHMENPVELLSLLASRCTKHLFLWTHYYDQTIISAKPGLNRKFTSSSRSDHAGFQHTLYQQEYQGSLDNAKFCGGKAPISNWMLRDEIIACLKHFGFQELRINFDEPGHLHGPAFALVASRSS